MNPLDSGPQNVLGKRPALVDPVVLEIVTRIERYINEGFSSELEFEARLGKLVLPSHQGQTTAVRLPLPILSEAILTPHCVAQNGRGFKYEFQAGLDKLSFEKVEKRMEELQAQKFNPATLPNPVFKILACTPSRTVDEVYKKPIACRVRYDWASYPGSTDPLEFILKENQEKIDVWMGHYPQVVDDEGSAEEEGQTRHPFDYRFAINKEKKLDKSLLAQLNRSDCVMRRERVRRSFEMKAWVVDLTTVVEASGVPKYEVEAELKLDLLIDQMKRRAAGKSHGVYQIIQDFLCFMRDLACMFGGGDGNKQGDAKNVQWIDLKECEPRSEELKRKYMQTVSNEVFPIIGDYIYRTINEVKEVAQ